MNIKKAKQGSEKLRSWEYENHILVWKDLWNWFENFMKLLEVKGRVSWNWGVSHVKSVYENRELNLEGSWNQ